jgi:hypothetical protein
MVVVENFISPAVLAGAQEGARRIYKEGRLQNSANQTTVRQDTICWVRASDGVGEGSDVEQLHPALLECLANLRGIAQELETLNYGRSKNHKVAKQAQLSRYAADGTQSYRPHRDASTTDNIWGMGLLGW